MEIRLLAVVAVERYGKEAERDNTKCLDWTGKAKGMKDENGGEWKRGWGWCFHCSRCCW